MKQAGFDVSDSESLHAYLLDQAPPAEQRLTDGFAHSEEWQSFIDRESATLDADSACRGSQYTEGMRTLGPKLTDFAAEHVEALAGTDAAWAEILDQAMKLGFEPVGG